MHLIRKRDWEWNMGDKGTRFSHFIHNIRNEWEVLFYEPRNSIVMGCLWLNVGVSEQSRRLAGYVPSWLDNVNRGFPDATTIEPCVHLLHVCLPYLPIYSSQLCALLIFTYRVSLAGIVCMSIAMEFGGLLFGVKKKVSSDRDDQILTKTFNEFLERFNKNWSFLSSQIRTHIEWIPYERSEISP